MKNTILFKTKIISLIAIITCIFLGMYIAEAFYIVSTLLTALLFFILLIPVWNRGQMTRLEGFEECVKNNE